METHVNVNYKLVMLLVPLVVSDPQNEAPKGVLGKREPCLVLSVSSH